jgi:protein SCO1
MSQTTTLRRVRVLLTALLGVLFVGMLLYRFVLPRLAAAPVASDPHQGMHDTVADPAYKGTWLDPPKPLGDFTLTSQEGTPLSLSDLRGKPALLFFGYTSCPDVCPTTLADFKQIQTALGVQAEDVTFVLVSVDGVRDTPARLAEYLKPFGNGFVGLTGDSTTVAQVAKTFGAYFEPVDGAGGGDYLVDHGAYTFLVDDAGNLRAVYSYGTRPDLLATDLRQLLDERAS